MVRLLFGLIVFLTLSEIAMAQVVEEVSDPNWMAKLLAWVIAIQVAMRCIAEALTRISKLTETKMDNKIAAGLGQFAWILGAFLGKMGWDVPKLVMEEQAKKLVEEKAVAKK